MIAQDGLIVQGVLDRWLQGKMAERKFDPTEFRLSESGACPRKRVMRALGYEGRAIAEDDVATFEEGNLMEDFLARILEERYLGRVERQVAVPVVGPDLPPCEGHADFVIWLGEDRPPYPVVVECKTVNRRSAMFGLPKEEHVLQVQAYLHFGWFGASAVQAEQAEIVYFLKGRKLDWCTFPVTYNPDVGYKIEDELRYLWQCVQEGAVPPIPDGHAEDAYPCFWTNKEEGTEHPCEFHHHCWQEAKAEAKAVVVDPELLRQYAEAKLDYSRLTQTAEQVKEEQLRPLEEKLAAALGGKSGVLEVGGVKVKGSLCQGRVTYDVNKAILAGAVSENALSPFRQQGDPYWRWTVTTKREG